MAAAAAVPAERQATTAATSTAEVAGKSQADAEATVPEAEIALTATVPATNEAQTAGSAAAAATQNEILPGEL